MAVASSRIIEKLFGASIEQDIEVVEYEDILAAKMERALLVGAGVAVEIELVGVDAPLDSNALSYPRTVRGVIEKTEIVFEFLVEAFENTKLGSFYVSVTISEYGVSISTVPSSKPLALRIGDSITMTIKIPFA